MDQNVLFRLGYGLYVATAKDGNTDNGCIINTVMQLTDTPLQIAVGLNKSNLTHDMILHTGILNLSVLAEGTPFSVFRHFGFQSGKKANKFRNSSWGTRAQNGLLYLSQYCNAYLSAKVTGHVDVGTHTLFLAEVTDCQSLNESSSMTYAYYHAQVKPKPATMPQKGWRCKVCGYIYEGDPLPADFICPICKHGALDFEKIS